MKKITEIEHLLNKYDVDKLDICNDFIDKKAEIERARGQVAEQRASIILGVVSAVSAILVASDVLRLLKNAESFNIMLYLLSIVWMLRAVWYSISASKNQSRKQVMVDSIFDFGDIPSKDAKVSIIAGKYWEYQNSIQPNTTKLFYVQRVQRALISSVFFLLLLGVGIAISEFIPKSWSSNLSIAFAYFSFVYFVFGDYLFEKKTAGSST